MDFGKVESFVTTNKYEFQSWYPYFKKCTMKSKIIPLNQSFCDYLDEDGILLPNCVSDRFISTSEMSDDSDFEEDESFNNVDKSLIDLGNLTSIIESHLKDLKNEVFIKLNWKAPTDAAWILGSMKCLNVADIYKLLKASDRIQDDIERITNTNKNIISNSDSDSDNDNDGLTLILRKWANLNSSMEFRCFIYKNLLVGISQRECSTYFDFLVHQEDVKINICNLIIKFWEQEIQPKARTTTNTKSINIENDMSFLENCHFDCYIDRQERVWLVDIGGFDDEGNNADPLLFEWSELKVIAEQKEADLQAESDFNVEFRAVQSENECRPPLHRPVTGPEDTIDLAKGVLPHGFEYSKVANQRRLDEESDSD